MFTVEEPTIRDLAWEGKGTIKYRVQGLERWSDTANFEIEVRRDMSVIYNEPNRVEWTYKVGSIGYSLKQTDPRAYLNYAAALKSAAEKIEQLVSMEDQLEAIFPAG